MIHFPLFFLVISDVSSMSSQLHNNMSPPILRKTNPPRIRKRIYHQHHMHTHTHTEKEREKVKVKEREGEGEREGGRGLAMGVIKETVLFNDQ